LPWPLRCCRHSKPSFVFLSSGFIEDVCEAFEAGPPQRFEFIEKFVYAAQLVDLATHELFTSAAVLGDQAGDDEDLDVLLHCGEADRIQPAELAHGALTVERLGDDVAPCWIAEREEQPVGLFRSSVSTTIWL